MNSRSCVLVSDYTKINKYYYIKISQNKFESINFKHSKVNFLKLSFVLYVLESRNKWEYFYPFVACKRFKDDYDADSVM